MSFAWRREEKVGADDALVLTLHVQPGARRTEVAGMHGDALKIRAGGAAGGRQGQRGAARFLAEAFGVPLREVTLVRGDTSRQKMVRIDSSARCGRTRLEVRANDSVAVDQ